VLVVPLPDERLPVVVWEEEVEEEV